MVSKAKYQYRKANGLCVRCEAEPLPGKTKCAACTEYVKPYNQNTKASRDRIKQEAFEAYGGSICVCCKETNPIFLTLDHINNDGAEHRNNGNTYRHYLARWVKANGYPPGFQVLCYNCNVGKHRNNGVCPHQS